MVISFVRLEYAQVVLRCLIEVDDTRAEEEEREEDWGDLVGCIVINATFYVATHTEVSTGYDIEQN